ncbi:MAG: threonylcarbamoyl-AMP synthase [Rickettsiaceae bacterium]|nr:threonylcarbamoyl-AMP synthase [Rickettsiaceae bacterium]
MIIAAKKIRDGELVAFPTETVYGLGADASNNEAAKKIYKAKGRPSNNPLIVHVADIESAKKIAVFNERAEVLAEKFWPGPLTFVLPIKDGAELASTVTAGLSTVAVRMPSHKIALDLIRNSGCNIAAPSANISGYISPTTASHVREAFGDDLYILEGEGSEYGLESTIVDLSSNEVIILRYGFITPDSIAEALGVETDDNYCHPGPASVSKAQILDPDYNAPLSGSLFYLDSYLRRNNKEPGQCRAPGTMYKHYSPKASMRINATYLMEDEKGIGFGDIDFGELNLSKAGLLEEAAKNLYNMMHILDSMKDTKKIAVAPIPQEGIGLAINDRLKRACS